MNDITRRYIDTKLKLMRVKLGLARAQKRGEYLRKPESKRSYPLRINRFKRNVY